MSRPARLLAVTSGLAALWWLLANGDPASWLVGVPTLAFASWSVWRLHQGPSRALSVSGTLRFLPLFVWESVRGGLDVARRTLGPRMRIRPGFHTYRMALQRDDARVFFTNCVCLLPGTLAVDVDDDRLQLHLLDSDVDAEHDLRRLERAVARIYP